jgi:type IV pilus assembly protein PilM
MESSNGVLKIGFLQEALSELFTGRFSSSIGAIGIDFGSRGIKMLQVREQAGTLHVVGAARLDAGPLSQGPHSRRIANGNPYSARTEVRSQLSEVSSQPARGEGGVTSELCPLTSDPVQTRSYGHAPQETTAPGDSHRLAASGCERLAEQIRAAFLSGGFRGPRCVVSLAREDVCLQSIRLPRMPDDELRQAAMWEASQRFGLDRNAMQVDFIRTGAMASAGPAASAAGAKSSFGAAAAAVVSPTETREEVILIAASHAAIAARVEPVLAAGLRPIAVDTGFSAMVRAFSRHVRREADRGHVRAILEVGESGSTVVILRGDQIAFCKPIAIGGRAFTQAVADHLRIEPLQAAELREARMAALTGGPASDPATDRAVYEAVRPIMGDLVKEVTLCLRYYGVTFRGHAPDHIIITGGDGLEPRLAEMAAHTCKAPVVFDDASASLAGLIPEIRATLNRTPGPAACWTVPIGLSLRGIRRSARGSVAAPAQRDMPPAGTSQAHSRSAA